MQTLNEAIDKVRSQLNHARENQKKNERLLEQLNDKRRWATETIGKLENQKKALREAMADLEENWRTMYASYYTEEVSEETKEQTDKPCYDFVSMDNVGFAAHFKGLKEACEKEHSDLEDKAKLLDSYHQMMDKLAQLIVQRGMTLEQLKLMAKEQPLSRMDADSLKQLKQALVELEAALRCERETLERYLEDKNKLFGSVSNGVTTIEEKYGLFKEISLENTTYADYVASQKTALVQMQDKYQQAVSDIDRFYKELHSDEDVRRDLERTIRSEGILFNRTREMYPVEMHLHKKYRELTERYQKLRGDSLRKKEAFEKDREMAAKSLQLLGAVELADVMRHEITLPASAADARMIKQRLEETGQIIRLEKERIEKTIQDMIQIKANFERQCLQRCRSIKTELDRFSAYSKIVLDGKDVPMVMLKIPYVKEETYDPRMSEYIDDVVKRADAYASMDERMRYIRRQLSWKRLFSVIVTDMNSIKLSLYKRERIKEQSRFLKYEEAVGSTGQSQGIYIQFLIAVINYISTIYSGHGEESSLNKVLFIDNPFGAAKDIYIWQPIFELLRTNHVQLIVPTRGATPAITGKFDVNYVLGQKMINHRQQTVVVDYSSNLDMEQMEYVKMDFEQEVFDFL